MNGSTNWLSKLALSLGDLAGFSIAFGFGCLALIQYGKYEDLTQFNVWWSSTGMIHSSVHLIFVGLSLIEFYFRGLYSKRLPFWDELRSLLATLLYLALINGMVVLVAKWPFSRVLWFSSWTFSMIFIPLTRSFVRKGLRKAGWWTRSTLIVGNGINALETFRALRSEPQLGFQVQEFIALRWNTPELNANAIAIANANANANANATPNANGSATSVSTLTPAVPVTELRKEELIPYLQSKTHCDIFVALDESELSASGSLIEEIGLSFQEVFFVPSLSGLPLFGTEPYHFFSHELLILRSKNNLGFRPQSCLKRIFDISVSATLLLLLSPLFLWIMFRIRLSGKNIFFGHQRVGHLGRPFKCYKFRTMVLNAENVLRELLEKDPRVRAEWEEKMKIENDPRVTPIGQFLRKTSLDELPQLWNVFRGDMSLVGPRPIVEKETTRYGHRLDFYLRVRPGLTGLWQVSGRSDTDYKTRVQLDTWYSKNWTLWYDLAILFKTVKTVIDRRGAY